MAGAPELSRLSDSLWLWQLYEPAVKSDLFATAVESGGQVFFVDPISLADSGLEELRKAGRPIAVLLTSGNHPRSAARFAEHFKIPIRAASRFPELADSEVIPFDERAPIAKGVEAISLPGGAPGETAFYFPGEGGTVVVGDALINFEPYGFSLLPAKYCTDPKALRGSLRELLGRRFERLLFAHGSPILSGADKRLAALLE